MIDGLLDWWLRRQLASPAASPSGFLGQALELAWWDGAYRGLLAGLVAGLILGYLLGRDRR